MLIRKQPNAGKFSGESSFLQTFPLMSISVMVAMVVVYWTRLYGDEQHGRRDMKVPRCLSIHQIKIPVSTS
jgi:hypothetical protein